MFISFWFGENKFNVRMWIRRLRHLGNDQRLCDAKFETIETNLLAFFTSHLGNFIVSKYIFHLNSQWWWWCWFDELQPYLVRFSYISLFCAFPYRLHFFAIFIPMMLFIVHFEAVVMIHNNNNKIYVKWNHKEKKIVWGKEKSACLCAGPLSSACIWMRMRYHKKRPHETERQRQPKWTNTKARARWEQKYSNFFLRNTSFISSHQFFFSVQPKTIEKHTEHTIQTHRHWAHQRERARERQKQNWIKKNEKEED